MSTESYQIDQFNHIHNVWRIKINQKNLANIINK